MSQIHPVEDFKKVLVLKDRNVVSAPDSKES